MTAPAAPSRLAALRRHLPRDKADTLLLLGAAVLVLAPHALHLPLWVSALCTATLSWRALITLRGERLPPNWLLLPLTLLAMGGIYLSYKTLLGREAGVAMAVLLVAFKMLEMHAKRDLFVVIFLCFFLVMTNFFYSQSMGTGAMMVASVIGLLTAQLSFQYTGAVPPLRSRLLLGAKIVAIAAPVALMLFFLFPRLQGPLWGMPTDAGGGRTGLSNSMTPGNISNLALSSDIAFRATFSGPVPPQQRLYWRGVVLSHFDGRTWSQARSRQQHLSPSVRGQPLRYQVTLEPHGERWLFALDLPDGPPKLAGNVAQVSSALELRAIFPIGERVRYDAASYLDYQLEADRLDDSEPFLALPAGFNPKAMQAGLDLQHEADPASRVNKVLAMFRQEKFSYTLEPPLLGADSVDDFLFGTKAGFCEHFASAFVFLMRAADVPARVVTGYQGGELNPVDGFMVVRQSDAHAWAEVWLAGRGWVRVDPTAAVAPERVERNMARALPPAEQFSLRRLSTLISDQFESTSLLGRLRFRLSAINNGWNQWVLNYDPERRRNLVESLSDALRNWRVLAAAALAAGLLVVARALRVRAEKDPVDRLYSALCQRLGRLGVQRAGDEGPNAYAKRLKNAALAAHQLQAATRFLHLYSGYKYAVQAHDPALAATLKRLLNSI